MIAVVALRPGLKSVNNAVKFISVKYSAYGAGSYDSQSQYFPYVDILNLTVEKIPYNIEAAPKLRSWLQITPPGPLLSI